MIEKNEKSGELMEVKEQAKTVRKHPERMIVRNWLVLALICLLAGLIAQYTFRLKEPLFLHYSQSAYLGCGLDGVETSEDGIVSSVSSEALEEESTDSDVKVGVLDEGVKDLNADMGLENTVSLYALGEESVDETDETSDVWYTQVNFAYLTDVTDEIFAQVKKLLYECWKCEPLRLIGMALTDLTTDDFRQISLFENPKEREKQKKADEAFDDIRRRFGNGMIVRGSTMSTAGKVARKAKAQMDQDVRIKKEKEK